MKNYKEQIGPPGLRDSQGNGYKRFSLNTRTRIIFRKACIAAETDEVFFRPGLRLDFTAYKSGIEVTDKVFKEAESIIFGLNGG